MFEKLKMKLAAGHVKHSKRPHKTAKNRRVSFWTRLWGIICWPFKKISQFANWLWRVICGINVVGLINVTLLVAIIVLSSMLIIDIVKSHRKPVVIVADSVPASTLSNKNIIPEPVMKQLATREPLPPTKSLPVSRDNAHKMATESVRFAKTISEPVTEKQMPRIRNKMYGDIVIDSRGAATILNNGSEINGNLYLEKMRKYVLPCNIKIIGNMFVRDVNMLQFCGDFEITGNIYVSPRSSFGPIPTTAHLGGNVIL